MGSNFCFFPAILIFFRLPVNQGFVPETTRTKSLFTGKRKIAIANSSNKTKVTVHEFLVNLCFIAAILILFCLPVNHDFVRVLSGTIYGQTKKNEYGSNKTKVDQKLLRSKFCFIAAILIFFVCP